MFVKKLLLTMTERTKTIKGLIRERVDMGTFRFVELELLAIEKDNDLLRSKVNGLLEKAKERKAQLFTNQLEYIEEKRMGLAQDAKIKIDTINLFIENLEEILN